MSAVDGLADEFATLVRNVPDENSSPLLGSWLSSARGTALDALAHGIKRDRAAVLAALVEPWSKYPVEGQITRPKFLKRTIIAVRGTICPDSVYSPLHDRLPDRVQKHSISLHQKCRRAWNSRSESAEYAVIRGQRLALPEPEPDIPRMGFLQSGCQVAQARRYQAPVRLSAAKRKVPRPPEHPCGVAAGQGPTVRLSRPHNGPCSRHWRGKGQAGRGRPRPVA